MRFIPREEKFYELFKRQAALIQDAANKLVQLFEDFREVDNRVREIKFVEHKGDQLTHEVMMKLNKTFITPLDREDIHGLSSAMDDVLDLIDGTAARFVTYKIPAVTPGALRLARVIQQGSEIIVRAVARLDKPAGILEYCDQLSQLEKDADRIKGECLGRLFENGSSPVEIIKWKEIYEVLEATTDKCEDVADALESVVLKAS